MSSLTLTSAIVDAPAKPPLFTAASAAAVAAAITTSATVRLALSRRQ